KQQSRRPHGDASHHEQGEAPMTFRPVPNPVRQRHKRTRGQKTRITQAARQAVYERSQMKCERCGRTRAYSFEVAHLINASQGGRGDDPNNLVLLCGPSVNTGTCHNWADYTKEGREWRQNKRKELLIHYGW